VQEVVMMETVRAGTIAGETGNRSDENGGIGPGIANRVRRVRRVRIPIPAALVVVLSAVVVPSPSLSVATRGRGHAVMSTASK
jgi:hypothetical protein